MKPSEILDKAADIIIRDGWHQGAYFKVDRNDTAEEDAARAMTAPCCQEGAIMRAAFGSAWPRMWEARTNQEKRKASGYMNAYVQGTTGNYSAIAWNDLSTTTKDDVVYALRQSANEAREAGE